MGMFDDAVKSVSDAVKKAVGYGGDTVAKDFNPNKDLEDIYSIDSNTVSHWYKALPYGFRFTPREDSSISTVLLYLPINPSDMTVSTHWGTTVIPTLYGTVEEHSDQRYYDIVISGNTGITPKYTEPVSGFPTPSSGRTSYKDDASMGGIDSGALGGFFQQTIGAINQAIGTVKSAISNFNGVSINTGVQSEQSGYIAFHNFYRTLLMYKKDASGQKGSSRRKSHPLTFLNYKDNVQYDCAVVKFELKRNSQNPMLYNYTIILRAYNMKTIEVAGEGDNLEDKMKQLGLDGIEGSAYQKMKQTANAAKGITGVIKGGLKIFGG